MPKISNFFYFFISERQFLSQFRRYLWLFALRAHKNRFVQLNGTEDEWNESSMIKVLNGNNENTEKETKQERKAKEEATRRGELVAHGDSIKCSLVMTAKFVFLCVFVVRASQIISNANNFDTNRRTTTKKSSKKREHQWRHNKIFALIREFHWKAVLLCFFFSWNGKIETKKSSQKCSWKEWK